MHPFIGCPDKGCGMNILTTNNMKMTPKAAVKSKKEKTQVVGFRIPVTDWHKFEVRCLENGVPMSKVLQIAVRKYLNN
jgi:hypothetical protein